MRESMTQRRFMTNDEAGTDEQDERTAFVVLVEEMVLPEEAAREAKEATPHFLVPPSLSRREFTCRSCHLVMPRSCLADAELGVCHECVREAAAAPVEHHWNAERPCPVCGRVMRVPERADATCGYFSPACGVLLWTRRGRRHLEWNHRSRPEAEAVPARVARTASPRVATASSASPTPRRLGHPRSKVSLDGPDAGRVRLHPSWAPRG